MLCFKIFSTRNLCRFQTRKPGFLLKILVKCRKFQPRYSIKIYSCKKKKTLIENDHLGDWSPEKDNCCRLTFRQPVRKLSSDIFLCLKMASAQVVGTSVLRRTPVTQMIIFDQGVLLLGSNHFLKEKGIHD